MKQKLLSISIAAYNVSALVRKALDSLLLEPELMDLLDVIIVNDGSRDDTLQIAEEYAEKYPGTFRVIDKENGGYGSTINASLRLAEGKYYKLLDGDDWYSRKGLRGLLSFLKDTDADLVVSPYYQVRKGAEMVPHHPEIPEKMISLHDVRLTGGMHFQMHGITVKTEVLRRYGHPIAEHCFYTDIEYLFYCFAASESIARYGRPVYCYRLDLAGQSVSLEGIRKHYRDHLVVTERICGCYSRECGGFTGTKKAVLKSAAAFSIYGVFNGFMLLPDAGKHRDELVEFDHMLGERYPSAYKAGNESRIVRTSRKLGFRLYPVLCAYMRWKFRRS